MKTVCFHLALTVCLLSAVVLGHGQLAVTGVADKSVYNDSVTFTVQAQAGYDYRVRLDSNEVPVNVPVDVNRVDYHELQLFRTNQTTLAVTNRLIRFIVRSSERGSSEDGIPTWTPWPLINSASKEFVGAHLRLIVPQDFPSGYEIPVVAWVENDQGHAVRVNGPLTAAGHAPIQIRRGVGSGFLAATDSAGSLAYSAGVRQLTAVSTINLESNTTWTAVAGSLMGNVVWPPNSRIAVTNHLAIPAGATLTIGAGTIVRLNQSVDVTVFGQFTINGTRSHPVVFMPASRAQPWGGFLLQGNTSRLTATGTVFTGSGAVHNWFGIGGRPDSHRKEQALFYCTNSPILSLTDCAAIYLAGQWGHAVDGGTFNLAHFLMQRCSTGGEFTGATFNVNDSAFLECPDDTANYEDGDNDALYIVSGTHGFTNTVFGWTKDDGVDSGESAAGVLNFQDCWFESIFHEGNALSGTAKIVNHFGCVFLNCGQGLESGYDGPVGLLDGCLLIGNLTGTRFGDNYDWTYTGSLRVTNSILIHNYRDVWGVNFQDWLWRTNAMTIQSNWLTSPLPQHPNNLVWQPATDAARLASFMNTPPNAPVGVGLAARTNRFQFNDLAGGLFARLSSFSTNLVSVGYTIELPGQTVATGRLEFPPGEIDCIIPSVVLPGDVELARVVLHHPTNAEITGLSAVYGMRGTSATSITLIPAGAVWNFLDTGEDAATSWRSNAFDATGWLSGAAELGYGDNDESTFVRSNGVSGPIITTYFRHAFFLEDSRVLSALTVRLRRDDGGIVYLNGSEIFRSNITNGPVGFQTLASEAQDDGDTFFSTNVSASRLTAGTNLLAVEIHQQSPTPSDLSFDLELEAALRPVLQLALFGNDWLLFWTDPAVLEEAETADGPWSGLQTSSPFTLDADNAPMRFYRLRQ